MKRITKIEPAKKTANKKLKVAAYARVSTNRDDQLISLNAQKNHYEKYIKAKPNWEYAGLYFDEGLSGTHMEKRNGLLKLLEDCERGKIDYIIVKSISRFSRNTIDSIETIRSLCEKGIYIFFEKENIDTGKMDSELLLSIFSSLAESESRSISENNKWGIQKRYQNGTFKISYPPYGYHNIDGQMVIDEKEAEIVRLIFSEVLLGKSPGLIARELNEKKIPTKRGKNWSSGVIHGMIKNEKYTGDVIFQKTFTDENFNRHINYGERNQYYAKDHHELIISHDTFEKVSKIIEKNGREKGIVKYAGKYQNRYALSGKIICGECGATWKRVKLGGYFGFACNTHIKNKELCNMKTVSEDSVKAAFATMMNKLSIAREVILIPFERMMKKGNSQEKLERLDELEILLEKNEERRNQVMDFFTKGLIDPAVYSEETMKLKEEKETFINEQALITENLNGNYEKQKALENILNYTVGKKIITKFDDDLFTEYVDHIVVYSRTEIGFAMKFGPIFRERI